jgi:hypothetical protein
MTKLGNYLERHERPYALRVPNGKGTLEVLFYDGYVTLHSRQPGAHFRQEIHISRRAWYQLLNKPQLKEVSRMMEGPSFDRYAAERRYFREERLHQEQLRAQKAERRGPRRRLRQL